MSVIPALTLNSVPSSDSAGKTSSLEPLSSCTALIQNALADNVLETVCPQCFAPAVVAATPGRARSCLPEERVYRRMLLCALTLSASLYCIASSRMFLRLSSRCCTLAAHVALFVGFKGKLVQLVPRILKLTHTRRCVNRNDGA